MSRRGKGGLEREESLGQGLEHIWDKEERESRHRWSYGNSSNKRKDKKSTQCEKGGPRGGTIFFPKDEMV